MQQNTAASSAGNAISRQQYATRPEGADLEQPKRPSLHICADADPASDCTSSQANDFSHVASDVNRGASVDTATAYTPTSMKAMVVSYHGQATIQQVPVPALNDDDLLVEIHASSFSAMEWKVVQDTRQRATSDNSSLSSAVAAGSASIMSGSSSVTSDVVNASATQGDPPARMGTDFSGVIRACGNKVSHLRVGDEVFGLLPFDSQGAFAELAVVNQHRVALKPSSMSHIEAASLPSLALNAWEGLVMQARLQPNHWAYIPAAGANADQQVAVQVAKAMGAQVLTTAPDPESSDFCRKALSADIVFDDSIEDPLVYVARSTQGRFADVVYDASFNHDYSESTRCVAEGGCWIRLVEHLDPSGTCNAMYGCGTGHAITAATISASMPSPSCALGTQAPAMSGNLHSSSVTAVADQLRDLPYTQRELSSSRSVSASSISPSTGNMHFTPHNAEQDRAARDLDQAENVLERRRARHVVVDMSQYDHASADVVRQHVGEPLRRIAELVQQRKLLSVAGKIMSLSEIARVLEHMPGPRGSLSKVGVLIR